MKALKSLLVIGSGCVTISASTAVPAQLPATTASPDLTLLPYASTADSAHLPDGRIIHLVCAGRGSPTVILIAAKGSWAANWNRVQPALAAKTRVCAWDRAGFGLSGGSPLPQTVDNTTSDLEAALAARNIKGPFVLVGHSMGSYETLLMADRHPESVLGMVLIDPSIPDQAAIFDAISPEREAYFRQQLKPFLDYLRSCAVGIRSGKLKLGEPEPGGCPMPLTPPPSTPDVVRQALDKQFRISGAMGFETIASYVESTDKDAKIVINPRREFGSKPLIVLRATDPAREDDLPPAVKSGLPAEMGALKKGHEAYAALSSRGVLQNVSGTGHFIQQDKPQTVINAVSRVIDEVRASSK